MIVDVEIAPGIWYKLTDFTPLADLPALRIVFRNPNPKRFLYRAPLVILEKRM